MMNRNVIPWEVITVEIIDNQQVKPNAADAVIGDYHQELEVIWKSIKRPDVYSLEKFTRFWDVRVAEPRSR